MKSAPIPKLSQDQINQFLAHMEPVFHDYHNKLWSMKPVNPYNVAFTWEPKSVGESHHDLVELERIRTRHTFGAPALFKPSINEVLAQIPEDLIALTVAFETFPEYDPAVGAMSQFTEDGEQHEATTVLYARA